MATTKKPDDAAPEEAPTAEAPAAGAVTCVNCGEPATQKSRNEAVNEVFYCDRHAQLSNEGVEPL